MMQGFRHASLMLIAFFGCSFAGGGTVTSISFSILDKDCYVGKEDANIVISFTPTTALALGGTITLNYPAGFFAAVTPMVISSTAVISAKAPDSFSNTVLLTLTSGSIAALAPFTITLAGLYIKKIPSGSVNAIWLTTSTDLGTPQGVSTGGNICNVVEYCTLIYYNLIRKLLSRFLVGNMRANGRPTKKRQYPTMQSLTLRSTIHVSSSILNLNFGTNASIIRHTGSSFMWA